MGRTIVISDVHLGTKVSRLDELTEVLHAEAFDRLVINGDLIQDDDLNRFKKGAWRFLTKIRKWTARKRRKEVIWVEGNHDKKCIRMLGGMLGVRIVPDHIPYRLNKAGRRYLFLHGHQFDAYTSARPVWADFWGRVYDGAQVALGDERRHLARTLKTQSKRILSVCEDVRENAFAYVRRHAGDVIVCGHVHHPEECTDGGQTYVNTGSCTEIPSTYLVIDGDGHRLCQF